MQTLRFTDETDVPVSKVFRFLIKPVSGVLYAPNTTPVFQSCFLASFGHVSGKPLFMFMIWALIQDIEMVDCSQDL